MIAAALAAGLAFAAPPPTRRAAYSPPAARRTAPAVRSAWDGRVLQWLSAGTRLCLASSSRADVARLASAYGARAAPEVHARRTVFDTPVWLFGPRGEVALSADGGGAGLRCALVASTGEATALARDLPGLALALGFARTPTTPARWPGEAAYRGRSGGVQGAYLFTAAPFIHGAPYGALLVVARPRAAVPPRALR